MKAEEKAKELYDKFYKGVAYEVDLYLPVVVRRVAAKQCAILCVEEIVASNPREPENNISVPLYWLDVIQAIKTL